MWLTGTRPRTGLNGELIIFIPIPEIQVLGQDKFSLHIVLHLRRWYEWEQEKAGLERVKHWASSLKSRLNDSDVIIHGHADEVGSIFDMRNIVRQILV